MRRFILLGSILSTALGGLLFVLGASAGASGCTDTPLSRMEGVGDDGGVRRDGGVVDVPEGGTADASAPPPGPSCQAYCDLVAESCDDAHPQYRSRTECESFCALFPPGKAGEKDTPTLGCRQYFAGSPARTDAVSYCPAAGPSGGNVCGDRCTAFCQIALLACAPNAPDGGSAPYDTYGDCQTACADFPYLETDAGDAGADEGAGDTLNCRLHRLRDAVLDPATCPAIAADSGTCRW